jgi:two-component system response regulator DesR
VVPGTTPAGALISRSGEIARMVYGQVVIRVLIVEDMHMIRGALVALLELQPDLEVVGEISAAEGLVEAVGRCRPDVVVLDLQLPGVDGLSAAAELSRRIPECQVLIITAYGTHANVRRALAGRVAGFLLKDAPPEEFADAVRAVARGRSFFDTRLALEAVRTTDSPLTSRETEVLGLLAEGEGTADIARQLFLSTGTVRNHVTTVLAKLNARNHVDAVRIAREAGWL